MPPPAPVQAYAATWSARTAHALAYVVNPLVLPPLLFGLVLAHFGAPAAEIARVVTVGLVFFGLVPLACVVWLVRRRRVDSIEVREREGRTVPFLVGLASAGVALVLLAGTGGPAGRLVVALTGCHLVNTVLVIVINLRWKISVHTSAVAGFASVLLFVARTGWTALEGLPPESLLLRPAPLSALLGFVPLLMWARVRTGAHSGGQVVAGALLGLLLPYAELHLLHHLGLLT
jgi:membrane-associated phospholipid phosphatase